MDKTMSKLTLIRNPLPILMCRYPRHLRKFMGHFLPARCYASAGISDRNVSVRPSVSLSVRLSVTSRYCVKTKKDFFTIW